MKARIYFWYKGAFHTRKQKGTIDLDIDVDKDEAKDNDIVLNRSDASLSDAINHGAIDHKCDAGIQNFGVEKVSFKNFTKSATFKL